MKRRRSQGVLDAAGVAERLGNHCASWFYQKREELEAAGFPRKDALLGGWVASAVQAWLDARGGGVVASSTSPEDLLLERARTWSGQGGRA